MKTLWGIRKGNEDWQEELITEDETKIKAAKKWAQENGFDRLRIADIDLNQNPLDGFRNSVAKKGVSR